MASAVGSISEREFTQVLENTGRRAKADSLSADWTSITTLKESVNMPFVKRSSTGDIIAVSHEKNEGFEEELDHSDPVLISFVEGFSDGKAIEQATLTQSDLDFVRVVEDLVEVLVAKNYILFTDLPDKAQEKMNRRQALRGKMSTHLDLLGDEDDGFF